MTLTLEKSETGARLLRFAAKRGIPLDDLIEEFLDDAEETEEKTTDFYLRKDDYKLTSQDMEALHQGAADIEAGRVSDGPTNAVRRRKKILQRLAASQEKAL